MTKYVLTLYVVGQTPRTQRTIFNLRRICEDAFDEAYELNVIDVLEYPKLAEEMKILATPTLIKTAPPPERRIIGDLSDRQKVLLGLHL
jgi:circadian clock protein KaiB